MNGIITPALVHERDLTVYTPDIELAFMFTLIDYEKRRHDQYRNGQYTFFTKILWPIALVQAGPENYIGIDLMRYFFNLQFSITEAPPVVKSFFNFSVPNSIKLEEHSKIFQDWNEKINTTNKSELKIDGIINPEILNGLVPLIRLAESKPLNGVIFPPLLSLEDSLEVAHQYNNALKRIEENIARWHSVQKMIRTRLAKRTNLISESSSTEKKSESEAIETLLKKVQRQIWNCRSEFNYLFRWALSGHVFNLVVPYYELWISMYLAQIILPNKTKKFIVIPPSIYSHELNIRQRIPIEAFHSSFYTILKEKFETTFETQKLLIERIESKCSEQNLFLKEDANKLIKRGFNSIEAKQLIERRYVEILRVRWAKVQQSLSNP
ncbi:MAG: hypothetical protein ACTSRS_00810 [Candidatus Helarchaeota archaeon]